MTRKFANTNTNTLLSTSSRSSWFPMQWSTSSWPSASSSSPSSPSPPLLAHYPQSTSGANRPSAPCLCLHLYTFLLPRLKYKYKYKWLCLHLYTITYKYSYIELQNVHDLGWVLWVFFRNMTCVSSYQLDTYYSRNSEWLLQLIVANGHTVIRSYGHMVIWSCCRSQQTSKLR